MTENAWEQVRSADGTTIGFRRYGSGPPVLVVHGGMQAAQNFTGLASALAGEFTVLVPDRRGRGHSGPAGAEYGMAREVEDMQAIVASTGATRMFGLSSGALVSLRTAACTPALTKIALYEPPLSLDGSVPTGWVPRFERELEAGRVAAGMVTVLKGLGVAGSLGRVPRPVLIPLLIVAARAQRVQPDQVPLRELVPTMRCDMRLVEQMADTLGDYERLPTEVLLLGGSKSPRFLTAALDRLERTLPHCRRRTFDGLGHSGPDDGGDPQQVAAELIGFLRDAPHR